MLARPFALHNPNCRGDCRPGDCVADLEAFCGSIRVAHFGVGVKRSDGSTNGQLTLSGADEEDVLGYLIGRAWELSQRFNPVDDGRGSNRLAGFLTKRLHFSCTDWTRARFGSTRYGPRLTLEPYDAELHDRPDYDDDPADVAGREIDLDRLGPAARFALENIIRPIVESGETRVAFARRMGVSHCRTTKALRIVRGELEAQGLAPNGR